MNNYNGGPPVISRVRNVTLLASLSAAALGGPPARSADTQEPGAPLLTVIVVGTTPLPGADIDRDRFAAPVQVATAQDIDRTHALDLTAFMNRTLASVYVNDIQNNPLQPDVSYRGYTASPLLGTPQGLSVYLDGVRLNQPFGDVVSWDLIPREAISTLTLIPGSNPLFGLNTLGGALALRTKDGFTDPGTSVEIGYGSDERRSVQLATGSHSDSGLYWYGTANQLEDDGWRDHSPTAAMQAFAKIGWRSALSDVALSGAYADTDLTGNGLQEQRFLQRDYASVYTKPDNTQNRAHFWNLVATRQASDNITLSANAYYRTIETATFNGDINDESLGESLYQPTAAERAALAAAGFSGFASGETQDNTPFPSSRCIANILLNDEPNEKCNGLINQTRTRQRDGGFSVQATLSSSLDGRANQLTVGAAEIRSRSRFTQSARFGFLTPDRGVTTLDGPGAFADGSQESEDAFDARVILTGQTTTRSVYLTDTLRLTQRMQLTLSGRYDRTTVQNRDGITPAGERGSLDGDHRFSRFNPAAGLTIAASDALTAHLGYSQGSRAPSVIELGCADPDNPCRLPNSLAGDPPLEQVITRTVEAGLRGVAAKQLAWNIGVFRADNRDDIIFVADDQTGFGYFENFGKTRRQGVELGVRSGFGPVQLGANYTFLDATYRTAETVGGDGNSSNDAEAPGFEGNIDIEPGDRIPLTPRHIFKTFAEWRITPGFATNVDLVSVSGSLARGNENNEHRPDGIYYLGPGKTSGYTVVNLGAEYTPLAGLKIFAQINNLLDREYFTASQIATTGFDAAGNFVARPFDGPVIDGERPLSGATFYAPGAPRAYWLGMRYSFGLRDRAQP